MKKIKLLSNFTLYDVCIFFAIVCNLAITDYNILCLLAQFLVDVYTVFVILRRPVLNNDIKQYCFFYLLFIFYATLSLYWTEPINHTAPNTILSFIKVGFFGLSILVYGSSENKIKRLICYYVFAGVLICLRFFIEVPIIFWGSGIRFDNTSIFGRNETAIVLAFCSLFLLWYQRQYNNISKIYDSQTKFDYINKILPIIFIFVATMTGTKIAMLLFFVGLTLLIALSNSKKTSILFNIISAIFILLLSYYMLLNIPFLYHSIGLRIELLLNGLLGNSNTDASTSMRMAFALNALEVFYDYPILGIGMDGFRYVNSFEFTYSHNNYLELLSNLGIIGFLIYYYRFYSILKIANRIKYFNVLPLMIVVILLIIDFAGVTYIVENSFILYTLGLLSKNINMSRKQ